MPPTGAAIMDIGTEQILAVLNLPVSTMPPTKFHFLDFNTYMSENTLFFR